MSKSTASTFFKRTWEAWVWLILWLTLWLSFSSGAAPISGPNIALALVFGLPWAAVYGVLQYRYSTSSRQWGLKQELLAGALAILSVITWGYLRPGGWPTSDQLLIAVVWTRAIYFFLRLVLSRPSSAKN